MDRPELLAFFEKRGIQTRRIPLEVLEHARQLIERLEGGESYGKLRVKRMHYDRCRISIPIGRRWRMLAADLDGVVRVRCILSHESYNSQK